jgi:hypothetical protein
MKTLNTIFAFALILSIQISFAQTFQVPQNVTLKTNEDYAKYEKDIISFVNWLEETPVNEQQDKRKAGSAFFITWITGAPNVTIELNADIANFAENPDLLVAFMGGWTRFVLENPKEGTDVLKGNMAGLKTAIKIYKKGNGIKKSKNIDKLIKMDDAGELEKWVASNIKK